MLKIVKHYLLWFSVLLCTSLQNAFSRGSFVHICYLFMVFFHFPTILSSKMLTLSSFTDFLAR